MSIPKLLLSIAICSLAFAAQAATTVPVSDDGYNRFSFSEPFETVIFPPGSPISGEAVALSGNTTLLIGIADSANEPIQMLVTLASGKVIEFMLQPGGNKTADWIQSGAFETDGPILRPQDAALVSLFKEVLAGPNRVPDGFTRIPTPKPDRIEGLTADYIAAYESIGYRIFVARLRADIYSPIIPQDLYVPGVSAVYIGGDAVGPNIAPLAIVLKARR